MNHNSYAYTLHHNIFSPPSRAIRIAMSEYGIGAELIDEPFWEQPTDLLKINPSGDLPVLTIAGEGLVCEVWPIAEFLEERYQALHKKNLLFPSDPYKRAEVRRLFTWFAIKFQQDVTGYILEEKILKRLPGSPLYKQPPEGLLIREAVNNLREHLFYIEFLINERDGLAGRQISYADIMAAGQLSLLDYLGHINWSKYPVLTEWYQRIKSRPSFRHLLTDKHKAVPPFKITAKNNDRKKRRERNAEKETQGKKRREKLYS